MYKICIFNTALEIGLFEKVTFTMMCLSKGGLNEKSDKSDRFDQFNLILMIVLLPTIFKFSSLFGFNMNQFLIGESEVINVALNHTKEQKEVINMYFDEDSLEYYITLESSSNQYIAEINALTGLLIDYDNTRDWE